MVQFRIYVIMYMKKHTASFFNLETMESPVSDIDGVIEYAKERVYDNIDRIFEATAKLRSDRGYNLVRMPDKIYFTVKILYNPPIKKRVCIEVRR